MRAREYIGLMTNCVIDVLRRSPRRCFPIVRDRAFDDLLRKLDRVPEERRPERQR